MADMEDRVSTVGSSMVVHELSGLRQEVQSITTSTFTGPNEVVTITTSADDVDEVQTVTVAFFGWHCYRSNGPYKAAPNWNRPCSRGTLWARSSGWNVVMGERPFIRCNQDEAAEKGLY